MTQDHDGSDPTACSRRDALVRASLTLGALALGCAGKGSPVTEVASDGGAIRLSFADHPALASAGGSEIVRADGKGKPMLVRNDGDAGVTALSLRCTHLGCSVKINDEGALACPCHGSRYAADGAVTKGPAKEALQRYPATIDGEAIVVKLA